MKKFMILAILCAFVAGTTISCDNRSQIEKDADKAASNIKAAIK
ncbi:MAG: hypothetical protein ACI9E5_000072 [Candidatus Omnitrophota bacterium]|jgi:hypothetical protein